MASEVTSGSDFTTVLGFTQEQMDTPRRVAVDGVDVTNRSAADLIALARYRRSSSLFGHGMCALVVQQFRPPSALGCHLGKDDNEAS